jgi:hypothetical protein
VSGFGTSALGERLQRLGEETGPRGGIGGAGSVNPRAPAVYDDTKPAAAADPVSRDLVAARDSTAGRPAAGIAEIRAQQAAEDQAADAELRQILAHAEEAMTAGKPNVARIYYQQLARRATGPLQQQALDGLKATASQAVKETPRSHGSTGP